MDIDGISGFSNIILDGIATQWHTVKWNGRDGSTRKKLEIQKKSSVITKRLFDLKNKFSCVERILTMKFCLINHYVCLLGS